MGGEAADMRFRPSPIVEAVFAVDRRLPPASPFPTCSRVTDIQLADPPYLRGLNPPQREAV